MDDLPILESPYPLFHVRVCPPVCLRYGRNNLIRGNDQACNIMNADFTILRCPKAAEFPALPRQCHKCLEFKTDGYFLADTEVLKQGIFVCDDCLKSATQVENH